MFYQELQQFYHELSNILTEDLINSLDEWLALLPENQQDKITVGRVANKFNIDFSIARAVLEKLSELKVLKRIFEIHCPQCGFVLKLTDEQNLYNDIIEIQSHVTCYECDEELEEITPDDIEVRYKLIKKPTNDPNKIKDTVKKIFNVDDSKYDTNNLNDILKKANYDSNKLFYDPTEEEYRKLDELLRGVFNANSKKEKGDSLEEFVETLLNLIHPITATKFARTTTNQLDTFAVNHLTVSSMLKENPSLLKMGHTFICECKNESKTPKNEYFGKLATELINSRINPNEHRFGIIFSKEAPPKTYLMMAKKSYYTNKISIVTFYKDELEEIVYQKINLLAYIDYKLSLIHEDLLESDEIKRMFL